MLTRDGRRVVTSFEGGATVIRDARTLRPLRSLPVGAQTAALSPDDRTVLLGGSDGSVRFLDLVTGDVAHRLRTPRGRGGEGAFNADGVRAITAGAGRPRDRLGRQARGGRRDAGGPRRPGHRPGDQPRQPDALQLRPRRQGPRSGISRAPAASAARSTSGPEEPTLRYALSSDGRVLAAGHADGTVSLIDARTLTPLSDPFRVLREGRSAAWGSCRTAGCSSSETTTASSPWSTLTAGR